jgi:tetratricopeptide (TPR) repeat protein
VADQNLDWRGAAIAVLAPFLGSSAQAEPAARTAPLADQAVALYNRGVAEEQKGAYDSAIADFTQAIGLEAAFADAYESRAVAYDQKGLYDLAIADYSRALKLKPDSAETYFNRGAAYEHRRLYQKALADYRMSLKLDPALQPSKEGVARLEGRR